MNFLKKMRKTFFPNLLYKDCKSKIKTFVIQEGLNKQIVTARKILTHIRFKFTIDVIC